jgi:hypothetical protein
MRSETFFWGEEVSGAGAGAEPHASSVFRAPNGARGDGPLEALRDHIEMRSLTACRQIGRGIPVG